MSVKIDKGRRKSRNTYTASHKAPGGRPGAAAKKSPLFTPGSIRAILADVLLFLLGMAVLGAIGFGSLRLYSLATTSEFFATRHIEVIGNSRLSREKVLQFAGLKKGDNSLAVSISRMEQALLATPWVQNVSIKRQLPDTFVISLVERMPSFWVHRDGLLYYANDRGEIIAPVESRSFLALPTLSIENGAEPELSRLGSYIRDLQSGRLPLEFGAIAGVTVSLTQGLELYLEDRELRLSIATNDWERNVLRMSLTLADLARRHELGRVREVRVSEESVWVVMSGRDV